MASGDARPFPQKNVAYRVTFPIFDNDGDLVTGAADLDSEVSKDGGTFADVTAEATEIATTSGMYFLDLTAPEMNADTVAIIIKTSTANAKTTPIVIYPEEAGDIRVDVTQISGDGTAADNLEKDYDGTGYAKTNSTIGTTTTNTDMRGTDSAALASVCTEPRLAALAAANLPANVDTLLARLTAARATLLDNLTNVMQPIRTGTAQGGTFGSITLDPSASVENSFYKGFCQITGGLGVGQSAPIVGYDGTTKVLDISPAWSTIPDTTSKWSIWPRGYDPASVLTESYAALGAAPTLEQALFAIQQGVLDFKVVGTVLTLRKLNGTDAMTITLNSATAPTDRVRAT